MNILNKDNNMIYFLVNIYKDMTRTIKLYKRLFKGYSEDKGYYYYTQKLIPEYLELCNFPKECILLNTIVNNNTLFISYLTVEVKKLYDEDKETFYKLYEIIEKSKFEQLYLDYAMLSSIMLASGDNKYNVDADSIVAKLKEICVYLLETNVAIESFDDITSKSSKYVIKYVKEKNYDSHSHYLSAIMSFDGINDEASEITTKLLKHYGIYGKISIYTSIQKIFYNRDIFEACGLDPDNPPKTMEEMREYARIITEKGNGDFYGFGLPLGVAQIWERIIDPILIAQDECGRYGYNPDENKYMFETNKRFFEFYLDLMEDGSLFPGYLTLGIDPLRANFYAGKVGMYIDGNWMVGQFPTQFEGDCNFDIAPLPVFEGETADKYWAEGGVPWMITNGPNQEAAKRFYVFWIQHQSLANSVMPVPRTYLPANNSENLPEGVIKHGMEYGFKTDDFMIPYFEPHYFITLEGDDRNRVFTNLFAEAAQGADISQKLDEAIADLNKRYTDAFDRALETGAIDPSWIESNN